MTEDQKSDYHSRTDSWHSPVATGALVGLFPQTKLQAPQMKHETL